MTVQFIQYPKCGTCKKAKAWLDSKGINYTNRHIVDEQPSAEELNAWVGASELPIKKFFNTCGIKYREMKLATQLPTMSQEEQIALLATDGMIVKRPILITEKGITTGFKEAEWIKLLDLES